MKNQNKTIQTGNDVYSFIGTLNDAQKRQDSLELIKLMQEISGEEPKMWGSSMVGFGSYHYKYSSGREGDFFPIGFSPRKLAITLYGIIFYDNNTELLDNLGPHKRGKGCLYIKKLSDVNMNVLKKMIKQGYDSKLAG